MLIKTILNYCLKYNSFLYQKVHFSKNCNGDPEIIIDIAARANGKKLCSICKMQCRGYDRLSTRLFKFIPIWGIPVFFRYIPRRVECPVHGVVVEYIPWAEGKSHLTNVLKIYLSYWAKHLSWSTVAEIFKVPQSGIMFLNQLNML